MVSVRNQLAEMLENLLDQADMALDEDTVFEDLPNWDSLVRVNLMFSVEQTFDVEFTGNQIFDFRTLGELERFIQSKALA